MKPVRAGKLCLSCLLVSFLLFSHTSHHPFHAHLKDKTHFLYEISIDGSTCLIECYDDPLLILLYIIRYLCIVHGDWHLMMSGTLA